MILELKPIRDSVASLDRAVSIVSQITFEENVLEVVRAGVIQNFEFTFEVSWKFMMRWLEENVTPHITQGITKRELFRLAAEHCLIDDVEKWIDFSKARNKTSHVYSLPASSEVYQAAIAFLPHAKYLLKQLEERNE